MKTAFLSTFLAVFILFDNSLGYTSASAWWTHITYNFQHANIWHLLVNLIAFWCVFKSLERHIQPYKIVAISLAVSIVCSFLTAHPTIPTVGASGMIYAMIGMLFSINGVHYLKVSKSLKKSNRSIKEHPFCFQMMFFIFCIALALIAGFFIRNSAGFLHLYCFVGGFFAMSLLSFKSFYKLKNSKI